MVNHSTLCRSIKYDYMNILTWTILKKTQILNGCETFAFKYTCKHTSMPNLRPQAYKTAYFIKENLIKYLMNQISKNLSVGEQDMTF